ncbi:MAG: guanylate cyclase [Ignavibacteriae bacterium HGW-Ignavibacteriae-3]|nr:MAG: guanylate cyclase [Ignavibacteriae bacterium HGW-Ignavibacteriae-3]
MSESIKINKALPDGEIYAIILKQVNAILNPEEPLISNLANVTAVLKESFGKISWVGFYLEKNGKLFLGPFQGKVACTVIENGKGVCGTSLVQRKTLIVEDVDKFPGHIACDSGSRSEIVLPLVKDKKIYGVLDLDSYNLSAFNEVDKNNLELLCDLLTKKLPFEKLVL